MVDVTSLDRDEMAQEMYRALIRQGVDVQYGSDGWHKMLKGIAEGIILHLEKHEQALAIPVFTPPSDTGGGVSGRDTHEHDHGGHVEVRITNPYEPTP
jgi:hypothetical protein